MEDTLTESQMNRLALDLIRIRLIRAVWVVEALLEGSEREYAHIEIADAISALRELPKLAAKIKS